MQEVETSKMKRTSSFQDSFEDQLMTKAFTCLLTTIFLLGLMAPIPTSAADAQKAGTAVRRDQGDRIIFGSIGEASNLIPYLSTDSASHEVADLLFIAPLRYNKDLEIEPWACQSYEMDADGKRIRFQLRPGIRWEDGQELTAYDMEFTFRLVTDPATASPYADDFLRVDQFTVLDRYSL